MRVVLGAAGGRVPCEANRAAWHRAGTAVLCQRLGTSAVPRVNNSCKIPILRCSVCVPQLCRFAFLCGISSGGDGCLLAPTAQAARSNVSPRPHSRFWNLSWHSWSSRTGLWGQELRCYWQLLSLLWAEHLQLSARFPSRAAPTSEHPRALLWSPAAPHASGQGTAQARQALAQYGCVCVLPGSVPGARSHCTATYYMFEL